MPRSSSIEPLESRIAPATLVNPLGDVVAGPTSVPDGTNVPGVTVELGQMLDPFVLQPGHTLVKFTLNLDVDPNTPGLQLDTDPNTPGVQATTITLELFDDEAPLTVQNFLRYALDTDNAGQFANDFVGTFFHRAVNGFVVQGGGFTADSVLTNHITTFDTVHNEFSTSRLNTKGTIAMAKVATDGGGGPNSATSEWFVNLADNTDLNTQNGGFTVFGRVLEGLSVFEKIAALPKVEFNGVASTDGDAIPVQNYTAGTTAVKPSVDQIIRVTGIDVIKPQATPANIIGQDFEVISIIDPLTGLTSDVVTTDTLNIAGSSLPLAFAAGKSGIADVKVRVTVNNEIVEDIFRVTVQPNLIASITTDGLPNIVVPGDVVKPTIKITNNGGAAYDGPMKVNFYLSPPINGDTDGRRRDADDLLIGSFDLADFDLARGGNTTLSESFALMPHFDKADGAYRLIAEVVPGASASDELFTDDNLAPHGSGHGYMNQFGLVSLSGFGSRITKLSYTEVDGETVTFSITGAGTGRISEVVEPGSGSGTFINVTVVGTNTSSIVNVGATDSDVGADFANIHHVDIANAIGTLNFGQAIIDGYITISSGAKVLNFGDVRGGDATLILGSLGQLNNVPATLNFGKVRDLSILSDQPIAAINAIEWLDTAGSRDNSIIAPQLTKLNIKGDGTSSAPGHFQADINIFRATTMSSFTVKGTLGGSMDFTPTGSAFNPSGGAIISTLGNVGTVSLGGMLNSLFFVGADSSGEFTERRSITSFSVKTDVFENSAVSAASIPALSIKGVLEKAAVKVTGEGEGFVSRANGLLNVGATGTTAASTATFTALTRANVQHIEVPETIGTFSFTNSNVTGHINFDGGAKVVKLGNITSTDQTLTLGDFGDETTATTLTLGKVSDLNLEAAQPIASLTAVEWLDKNTTENHITAETLTKLNIKGVVSGTTTTGGNLQADVNVTGSDSPVSSFVVAGMVSNVTIASAANVGTVKLGGMTNANFFVGTDTRPTALGDFDSNLTINSFTIAGITGVSQVFANSQVAAQTIAKIVVKGVNTASGTGEFGFVADTVNSYARAGQPTRVNLTTPGEVDAVGNYSLTIL